MTEERLAEIRRNCQYQWIDQEAKELLVEVDRLRAAQAGTGTWDLDREKLLCEECGGRRAGMSTTKEWLAHLKAGDEVILRTGGYDGRLEIVKVARITPTGRIVVDYGRGSLAFDPENGYERTSEHPRARLEEPTAARREETEALALQARLKVVKWSEQPLPVLRKVWSALKEGEG